MGGQLGERAEQPGGDVVDRLTRSFRIARMFERVPASADNLGAR